MAAGAQAAVIALYNFQDQTLNDSAGFADGTISSLTLGPGLNQNTAQTIINNANSYVGPDDVPGTHFTLGGGSAANSLGFRNMNNANRLDLAIDDGDYLEYSITPNAGQEINLWDHEFSYEEKLFRKFC